MDDVNASRINGLSTFGMSQMFDNPKEAKKIGNAEFKENFFLKETA